MQLENISLQILFGFFGRLLCMENLVRPYLQGIHNGGIPLGKGSEHCGRENGCFLEVNGDSKSNYVYGNVDIGCKWIDDKHASTEMLTRLKPETRSDENTKQIAIINCHLSELMYFVNRYKERLVEKDRRDRLSKEWKAAGLIFDRIFFIVYLIAIVTSLCVVLPIITLG